MKKCPEITLSGQWVQTQPELSNWQSPNCMLHHYEAPETQHCLAHKRALFIGDSTSRQVFLASIESLNVSLPDFNNPKDRHKDWKYESSNGVTYEFIWDPLMNDRGLNFLNKTLNRHRRGKRSNIEYVYISYGRQYALDHPSKSNDGMKRFRSNLRKLAYILEASARRRAYSKVILSPVIVPVYEKLEGKTKKRLTKERVDQFNKNFLEAFPLVTSSVYVPQVFNTFTQNRTEYYDSTGVYFVPQMASLQADFAYNIACNSKVAAVAPFPYDKTCCLDYPKPRGIYQLSLWLILFLIPVGIFSYYVVFYWGSSILDTVLRSQDVIAQSSHIAVTTLALTLLYAYLCDRTHLFAKGNKHYQLHEFLILCGLTLVAGFASLRRIDQKLIHYFQQLPTSSLHFPLALNELQVDEWKGLLIIIVSIYHFTGASTSLAIYKILRIMISSYLFLSGYTHTTYFINTRDFSLKRVASVLLRLNIVALSLTYVMDTNYMFYYLAPLLSFWFGVVWTTFSILPQFNAGLRQSLAKTVIASLIVYFIISIPGPLEAIFWITKNIFRANWSVLEFRSLVIVDFWAAPAGIITSILINNVEMKDIYQWAYQYRYLSPVAGIHFIVMYWFIGKHYSTVEEYDGINKYLGVFPIIGYLLVRNGFALSELYSRVFVWFGQIYMELFVLQSHIWSAGDSKGVLYMIDMGFMRNSGDRSLRGVITAARSSGTYQHLLHVYDVRHYINLILVTIPFLILAAKAAGASDILTAWFITPEVFSNNTSVINNSDEELKSSSLSSVLFNSNDGGKIKDEEAELGNISHKIDIVDREAEAEAIQLKDLEENAHGKDKGKGKGKGKKVEKEENREEEEEDEEDFSRSRDKLMGSSSSSSSSSITSSSSGNSNSTTGGNIVTPTYSSSTFVRLIQKFGVLFAKLSLDLRFRVIGTIFVIWVINLLW